MLNLDVNVACINAPFKTGTICGVSTPPEKPSSPSYVRLEAALREHLRSPVELEQQRIADEMNESAQTVHNWRYRSGVSQRGALAAQRLCGASATYILTGEGPKTASGLNKPAPCGLFHVPSSWGVVVIVKHGVDSRNQRGV